MAEPHRPHEGDPNLSVEQIVGREREILRALCTSPHVADKRGEFLGALSLHHWRDPEHRVVYEALRRIRGRDTAALHLELPATATRMGFPDVEWTEFFGSGDSLQNSEVAALIRTLTSAAT